MTRTQKTTTSDAQGAKLTTERSHLRATHHDRDARAGAHRGPGMEEATAEGKVIGMAGKAENIKASVVAGIENAAESIMDAAPNQGRISRAATALAAHIERVGNYLDQVDIKDMTQNIGRFAPSIPGIGLFRRIVGGKSSKEATKAPATAEQKQAS